MSEAGAAQSRLGAPSRPAAPSGPSAQSRPAAPSGPSAQSRPAEGLGVYVHIPFCARRCDYCAFATWTDLHHLAAAYADACLTELEPRL